MFKINITTRDKIEMLKPRHVIAAEVRAINKTARGLRTQISKGVRKRVALKSSTVKQSLSLEKARRRANPQARLSIKPKPISLKHYGARQIRKGVSVRVKKSSGRKLIKHAFMVAKLGGHPFQRDGEARLPISKLWGPSVRQQVGEIRPELEKYILKSMGKRTREEIDWELEKARRRRRRRR